MDEGLVQRKPSRSRDEASDASAGSKPPQPQESKRSKILNRLIFGLLLIFVFLLIVYIGHLAIIVMFIGLQSLSYRELIGIRYRDAVAKEVPLYRTLQWAWFGVAMFYVYGEIISAFFLRLGKLSASAWHIHTWISLFIYILLFVLSTLSFKKDLYKYQVGQLAWTLLTIALIVVQVQTIIDNLFAGMFWVVFPISLIICNDTLAYVWGMLIGRKFITAPFLKLSPNKTWEGFIGGGLSTVLFAFLSPVVYIAYLSPSLSQWMLCPLDDLPASSLTCELNSVFVLQNYSLPWVLGGGMIALYPIQLHGMVLGVFASLIAPFGGFFASALKRAYQLKDYGTVIPGHGGAMDRFDCQYLIPLFTYVYYRTFLRPSTMGLPALYVRLASLTREEQHEVLGVLQKLITEGIAAQ